MNTTIGLTAFRGFQGDDEMKRPDIRMQVIAKHREITWHRINKVREQQHETPCIVYMDALYFISPAADGRVAFPGLMAREGKLGGYKYEGRIDLNETFSYTFKGDNAPTPFSGTLRELVNHTRYSEGNKLEVLNAKGWTK
jgi:hypothetical protein